MKAKVDSSFFSESTFGSDDGAWASSFCGEFASTIPAKTAAPTEKAADAEFQKYASPTIKMSLG